MGERWYTLDRSPVHHKLTQRQTAIHTHTYGQFRLLTKHACSLTVGGNWSSWRKPTPSHGDHTISRSGNEPGTFLLLAMLTTVPPCHSSKFIYIFVLRKLSWKTIGEANKLNKLKDNIRRTFWEAKYHGLDTQYSMILYTQ